MFMEILIKDREIAGIIPSYTQQGDQTLLYKTDGSCMVLPMHPEMVVRQLAERRQESLYLLRRWAGKCTGSKLWEPLGISWELVLVPLKMRKPRVPGDTATGYVSFSWIEEVEKSGDYSCLRLKNQQKLPVLWTWKTVVQHLQNAFLVQSLRLQSLDDVFLRRMALALPGHPPF